MMIIKFSKIKEFINIYIRILLKNKRLLLWFTIVFLMFLLQNFCFADPNNGNGDGEPIPDPNPFPNEGNNSP